MYIEYFKKLVASYSSEENLVAEEWMDDFSLFTLFHPFWILSHVNLMPLQKNE